MLQNGQRFKKVGLEFKAKPVPTVTVEDIVEGDGPSAESGDTVVMKYVGTLDSGERFDSGSGFTFQIDGGDVIKGWDQGIKGMKVGGKRKLHVPSSLGYGKRGAPPEIPANANLNFIVQLQRIA